MEHHTLIILKLFSFRLRLCCEPMFSGAYFNGSYLIICPMSFIRLGFHIFYFFEVNYNDLQIPRKSLFPLRFSKFHHKMYTMIF